MVAYSRPRRSVERHFGEGDHEDLHIFFFFFNKHQIFMILKITLVCGKKADGRKTPIETEINRLRRNIKTYEMFFNRN